MGDRKGKGKKPNKIKALRKKGGEGEGRERRKGGKKGGKEKGVEEVGGGRGGRGGGGRGEEVGKRKNFILQFKA